MIPRVEDLLVSALEARIVAVMPETAPGAEGAEPFITTIEKRKVTPCVQEQETLRRSCTVDAEISVILYNQKHRYDYSALLADFAVRPWLDLGDGVHAQVAMVESETVEGPYLSQDAWLFKARYGIYDTEAVTDWQSPAIHDVAQGDQDIYPCPVYDGRNDPDWGWVS